MSKFNCVVAWLVVDSSIEDNTVFYNKVIVLNKPLIEFEYKIHPTKNTTKNLTVTECFLVGVDEESKHYQEELEDMQSKGELYRILGDYLPKGD